MARAAVATSNEVAHNKDRLSARVVVTSNCIISKRCQIDVYATTDRGFQGHPLQNTKYT